jgi:hypothetical protein
MTRFRETKFISPDQVYRLLGSDGRGVEGEWAVPSGERCRAMLARVVARVPHRVLLEVICRLAVFVTAGGAGATYLSAKFLRGRHVVLLGEGLLGMSEDEQAAVILPQVARAVLGAPHPLERVREDADDWDEVIDKENDTVNERAYREVIRLHNNAVVDLKIDVHFAGREADALARSWQELWREYARRTA